MLALNNLTKETINLLFFRRIVRKILKEEGVQGKIEISLAVVSPRRIREINKKYRQKDEVTDVLSFYLGDKTDNNKKTAKFIFPPDKKTRLGEIIICPQFVREEAKKEKKEYKRLLERVFIHGILHLLKYNHIRAKDRAIMEEKEEKYLSLLKPKA